LLADGKLYVLIHHGCNIEGDTFLYVYDDYGKTCIQSDKPDWRCYEDIFIDVVLSIYRWAPKCGRKAFIKNLKYYVPPTCKEAWIYGAVEFLRNIAFTHNKCDVTIRIFDNAIVVRNESSRDIFYVKPTKLLCLSAADIYAIYSIDFSEPFIFGKWYIDADDIYRNDDMLHKISNMCNREDYKSIVKLSNKDDAWTIATKIRRAFLDMRFARAPHSDLVDIKIECYE